MATKATKATATATAATKATGKGTAKPLSNGELLVAAGVRKGTCNYFAALAYMAAGGATAEQARMAAAKHAGGTSAAYLNVARGLAAKGWHLEKTPMVVNGQRQTNYVLRAPGQAKANNANQAKRARKARAKAPQANQPQAPQANASNAS